MKEEAANFQYTDPAFRALGAAMGHGLKRKAPVRLVTAEYLIGLFERGERIKRRQELPESAFYDAPLNEAASLFIVSYRWITKSHPDPEGFHLGTLAPVLRSDCKRSDIASRVAVFIDFCCLYQSPRSDDESALFKKGLSSINLLYAHQTTYVLCLTRVPAGVTGYDVSGWVRARRRHPPNARQPLLERPSGSPRPPSALARPRSAPLSRRSRVCSSRVTSCLTSGC